MNDQTLKGTWNEVRGLIREKWGQLTDDEVERTGGNLEQLLGLIQKKTGEGRDKIEKFLDNALDQGGSMAGRAANAVQELAASAAESSMEYAQQAVDVAKSGLRETQRVVQQRPVESLAVCFGVGLISGIVVALAIRSR